MAAVFKMAAILIIHILNTLPYLIFTDFCDKGVYIYVVMSGKYIYDILQWISVQNGGHLFQNSRNSVVKLNISHFEEEAAILNDIPSGT